MNPITNLFKISLKQGGADMGDAENDGGINNDPGKTGVALLW